MLGSQNDSYYYCINPPFILLLWLFPTEQGLLNTFCTPGFSRLCQAIFYLRTKYHDV